MGNNGERTPGTGLALSGGGFRATLFHLGSLWRLNELGCFPQISEITGVSGGAIVAAFLGKKWNKLDFNDNGVAESYVQQIVNPLRFFCRWPFDKPLIITGAVIPILHPAHLTNLIYRLFLFGGATLQDLPDEGEEGNPRITLYATSLQTGASVRFARPYLADYRVGYMEEPEIKLAKVVAASTAFPPWLSPVIVKTDPIQWKSWEEKGSLQQEAPEKWQETKLEIQRKGKRKEELKSQEYRWQMYLGDGGIYDNIGLERIWDRYETVLVSDASAPFDLEPCPVVQRFSWIHRALRANEIITEQTRALRRRQLIEMYKDKEMNGAYWGIASQVANYELEEEGKLSGIVKDSDTTGSLAHMRTRLNRFTEIEQCRLINWGYAITDAAMRRWVPGVPDELGKLPLPDYGLGD